MESEQDDSHIIEAAQLGDHEALEVLVDNYMDDVFLHLLQALPDPLVAEGVAEEVFRTMITLLPTYAAVEAESFEAWLLYLADEELVKFLESKRLTDGETT